MDKSYDVIMFYGPPFGGKTAYFYHILRETHQRVSAAELFQENPDIGLRQVILKIASLLRDGKKVVIDDENWTKALRTSYVKTLSAKFPKCKFLCLKFNPEELVSYWSMEWYLAEKVLQHDLSHICDLKKASRKLHHWYGNYRDESSVLKLEEPRQEERMTIKVVKPKLLAQVDYKFEVPALFLQWEAVIVSSNGSNSIHTRLIDVINCWLATNPWGRVIIIFDSMTTKRDSVNSDSSEDLSVESYKPLLSRLCNDITVPVYMFQIQSPVSDQKFCCPPQPGILAFLQRLHHLHLFHRHTLYLYGTNDHYKMADGAGVRHAPAKTVLCKPLMVVSSKCATKVAVKHELKDINFKPRVTGQSSSPDLHVPLFTKTKESTFDGQWGYYEELLPWKYMHGICFHDLSTVERYQQLYADTASRLSEPGSRMISTPPAEVKPQDPEPEASVQSSSVTTEKAANQPATSQSRRGNRAIPSWLVSKNCKQQKDVDDFLQAGPPSLDSSLDEPVTKYSSPDLHVPLFTKTKESTFDGQWGYYEELLPWKYMHGICFHDLSTVERYQQLYADTASRLSEPGSRMISPPPAEVKPQDPEPEASVQSSSVTTEKAANQPATSQSRRGNRAIPSWLVSKNCKQQKDVDDFLQAGPPSLDSSLDEPVTKKKKTVTQPSTIYCMNVLELLETAQLVLLENGITASSPVNLTKTSPNLKPVESIRYDSIDTTKGKNQEEATNKSSHSRTCTKTSSTQVKQHHVVPETITTIPETEGFQATTSAFKGSLEQSNVQLKSGEKHSDTAVGKTTGPDLSFLDDIF
ncbi:uncharacterized protein [Amphiura filiformis]|uniref:uncharacterized protein n=1 Tax=Amphiura filiformis TaxID=82378 RepID=UPI003B217DE5